jgi:hypothetical protein
MNAHGAADNSAQADLTQMVPLELTMAMEMKNRTNDGPWVWNGPFGATMVAINREWGEFVKHRLDRDLALAQNLTVCKAPDDVWRIYSEFWVKAAEEYQQELVVLSRLGNTVLAANSAGGEIGPQAAATAPGPPGVQTTSRSH